MNTRTKLTALLLLAGTACDRGGPAGDRPQDSGPPGTDDSGGGDTDVDPTLDNRLLNPGFELGESWWRSAGGAPSHAWATSGETIHDSSASFEAHEGSHAQKIWGLYAGDVPNDIEHGLTLVDLTPGDEHRFAVQAFTHSDDALTDDNHAVAFLRYLDASGTLLSETASSARMDASSAVDSWTELEVEALVPEGAATGQLGVRFHLASWDATGSIYLDAASWTSTGSGSVEGERLLTWNDEFEGDSIDSSVWTHELLPAYTYNNELQAYTDRDENSAVRDGQLIITGRQESYEGASYTSARLNTSTSASWLYGRIEGQLQVPSGIGTWPAMWMLPTDWSYGGWPDSGEIDIMEHVGCDPDMVHGTVHTGAYNHMLGTQQGGSMAVSATSSMHVYAVEWTPEQMVFSIDDTAYFTFDNDGAGDSATWPFDQRFHIILNLAIGGDWGGYCGVDAGAFPQEYRIDWVRVYQ